MSKYIIDTGDYLFTTDGVLVVGFDCDNKPATFYNSLDNLEELNSDYINENFGELQDEAYQAGMDKAWEIARRIRLNCEDGGIDGDGLRKMFGTANTYTIIKDNTASEAVAKIKAYDNVTHSDRIEVGDEVTHKSDSAVWKAVCIRIDGDRQHMNLMGYTGAVGYYPVDDFKKTGRHFDIASILEAMHT